MKISSFDIRMDKVKNGTFRVSTRKPFDTDDFLYAFDAFGHIIGEYISDDAIPWDVLEDAFCNFNELEKWQYFGGSNDAPLDYVMLRFCVKQLKTTEFDVVYEIYKGKPLNSLKTALGTRYMED